MTAQMTSDRMKSINRAAYGRNHPDFPTFLNQAYFLFGILFKESRSLINDGVDVFLLTVHFKGFGIRYRNDQISNRIGVIRIPHDLFEPGGDCSRNAPGHRLQNSWPKTGNQSGWRAGLSCLSPLPEAHAKHVFRRSIIISGPTLNLSNWKLRSPFPIHTFLDFYGSPPINGEVCSPSFVKYQGQTPFTKQRIRARSPDLEAQICQTYRRFLNQLKSWCISKISPISSPLQKATRKAMFNLGILHSTNFQLLLWQL